MSELFKFSYFCNELNKLMIQVNIFKSLEAALEYAATCGTNATAELWDGNENY